MRDGAAPALQAATKPFPSRASDMAAAARVEKGDRSRTEVISAGETNGCASAAVARSGERTNSTDFTIYRTGGRRDPSNINGMATTFQRPRGEQMIEVEEAQRRVLAEVPVFESEEVALVDALGRVLRQDVAAPEDVPQRDNSAMDGYAVRADDVAGAPLSLRVIEDLPAGTVAAKRVDAGTAIRIMTGALLPEGADAVVQVELTDGGSDFVV